MIKNKTDVLFTLFLAVTCFGAPILEALLK